MKKKRLSKKATTTKIQRDKTQKIQTGDWRNFL